jgi:hypothetical protein
MSKAKKTTNEVIMIQCLQMAVACQGMLTSKDDVIALAEAMYNVIQAKKE